MTSSPGDIEVLLEYPICSQCKAWFSNNSTGGLPKGICAVCAQSDIDEIFRRCGYSPNPFIIDDFDGVEV